MSGKINMSIEDMERYAKEYGKMSTQMGNLIKDMEKVKKTIESTMESETVTQFCAKFVELKPGFVEMNQLIDEISKRLADHATDMRNAVAAGKKRFQ